MMIEEAPDYKPKAEENVRKKAMILAMRANEAADTVASFGDAVMNGVRLIEANDVKRISDRLRYYAKWLERIAEGEPITEEELQVMEDYVKSIRVPKKNAYKRDIIEVTYVMTDPESGKATRVKLAEVDQPEQIYRGDTVKIPHIHTGEKYGHRLPVKA